MICTKHTVITHCGCQQQHHYPLWFHNGHPHQCYYSLWWHNECPLWHHTDWSSLAFGDHIPVNHIKQVIVWNKFGEHSFWRCLTHIWYVWRVGKYCTTLSIFSKAPTLVVLCPWSNVTHLLSVLHWMLDISLYLGYSANEGIGLIHV